MAELTQEEIRLQESEERSKNWKRWGPYLSERQWSTVREDYSADGNSWDSFPHEHSRSRAYRWGEDGMLGITDRQCRLCFALSVWNEKDPILKERMFGLTGPEGNHGEDPKDKWWYLDSTPTHSYMKGLYKYPQAEFPYADLVNENARRSRLDPEYEVTDTGVFAEDRYFDIFAEYAKADDNDLLIKVTIHNRGPEDKPIHFLPTLWYRNTWVWGCKHEACWTKPRLYFEDGVVEGTHEALEDFFFYAEEKPKEWLFTENETNFKKLYNGENYGRYTKDGFHDYVVNGQKDKVNPKQYGTKCSPYYNDVIKAGGSKEYKFRLAMKGSETLPESDAFENFDKFWDLRVKEGNEFYDKIIPSNLSDEEKNVSRQSFASLLWSKQFFHYIVKDWLEGDENQPKPPDSRYQGRNVDWKHLYNRDIVSMPDKWEYPWYAVWDLAFHMIPFAHVDPFFAKAQLILFLREWYMHPNGAMPAYEFNLSDVNPPVHAWACWKVYQMTGANDHDFLMRCFTKLMLNFTWWVNRKDAEGNNIFSGGFLGLDNISIFDRSKMKNLEQADGTAWMAFFCSNMLNIALELALHIPAMEDIASKFFEHFVQIIDAMNTVGGTGLWDKVDGFYYDQLKAAGKKIPLRIRSMVGLIPLCAVNIIKTTTLEKLPGFAKRMKWFMKYRPDVSQHITFLPEAPGSEKGKYLVAVTSQDKIKSVFGYLFDENEFLSKYGIRSISRKYKDEPFSLTLDDGKTYTLKYTPGESDSSMFGGNSNWRGPIWFPVMSLVVTAIRRYNKFFGEEFTMEFPTGSGEQKNLAHIADLICERAVASFLPSKELNGLRPCHLNDPEVFNKKHWDYLVNYYEHFHGDTGRGLGAEHQSGWTALVSHLLWVLGKHRSTGNQSSSKRVDANCACPNKK